MILEIFSSMPVGFGIGKIEYTTVGTTVVVHHYLIFVKLAVFVGGLSLVLEGDDDETYEDVDHEEGDDDDVDEVEDGHQGAVVVDRADVLRVGVDRHVKDARPTCEKCISFYLYTSSLYRS